MHTIISKHVKSLSELLSGIIDYAGIFPPASLPLSKAWNNYLEYLKSPHKWMLGKFICPAKLLAQLENLSTGLKEEQSIYISVITTEDEADFISVRDFIRENKSIVKVGTIEFRMEAHTNLNEALSLLLEKTSKILPEVGNLFCEVSENFPEAIKTVSLISTRQPEISFKLRTGGTESSAFPSSEQIANVIKLCREHNVKMKCTAGLHHPVRHFSNEVNTKMHGFLNVFAAGVLAYSLDFTKEQLTEILNDEKADNFKFSEAGFSWNNYSASIEQISAARRDFIVSFGSCSFNEPVNDLKALELL